MSQIAPKVVRQTGVFVTIQMFVHVRLDILVIPVKTVYPCQDVSTEPVIKVSNVTATLDGEECIVIHVSIFDNNNNWPRTCRTSILLAI